MASSAIEAAEQATPDEVTRDDPPRETVEPEREVAGTGAADPLPLDVRFELLKNPRRRAVLRYLEDESASATIGTLAEHLAAEENDKPVGALTSSERKRVYICLYQCHLPKLDDTGVVDFDSDRGTVERNESASQLMTYLAGDAEQASSRRVPYSLGVAGLGGVAALAGLLLWPSLVGAVSVVALLAASLLAISVVDATR